MGTPFTTRLPPELQVLKDEQAHRLAPKGSQSRILRQACKRMAEAKQKVCGSKENIQNGQASDWGSGLKKEATFRDLAKRYKEHK